MIIKVKYKRSPGAPHVENLVYVGQDREHLQFVGKIMLGIDAVYKVTDYAGPGMHAITGEWQMFTSALELGAARMNGDVEVIQEGDDEITRQLEVEAHEH